MLELGNDILQGLREDVLRLLDARPPDDQPLLLVRLRDDVKVDVEDVLVCYLAVVLRCDDVSSAMHDVKGGSV